jgi:Ras association domain-containing protein 7/8
MVLELVAMELKVWVDGIQRVVCGVSEQTTCQEVVIALAPARGAGVEPGCLALFFTQVR